MKNYKQLLMLLLAASLLFSCSKKDNYVKPKPKPKSDSIADINKFIKTTMTDIYLWSDKVDANIDYKKEKDPKEYFQKLIYKEKDKWSWITDDVVALQNSFAGKEKSFGYSLTFGKFTGTNDYFAIIEYVYPETPAAKAGLKRGSLIVELDGKGINGNNYMDLLYGDNITITKGKLTGEGIVRDGKISMTSLELDLDPVLITKVIEQDGKKIGYLFYSQYIGTDKYIESMDNALQQFKDAGVTDVVLDLRYNGGGAVTAAKHLCSSLAPESVVNKEDILITYQWNEKYQNYFQEKEDFANLEDRFDKNVPVKLNLDKLYVLTGRGTASASELTITGLKPYMNEVVTIGGTTHGKYCASITVTPKNYYEDATDYKSFKNWAIQPIVTKYANASGVTDFEGGFEPVFAVKDELLPAIDLGNIQEPLLKKAIEAITGKPIVAKVKTAKVSVPDYEVVGRGFSRFDKQKEVLNLGTIEMPVK